MKIFHITSTRFEGYIELKFDESDKFKGICFLETNISEDAQKWFLKNIPANVHALGLYKQYDTVTVTEMMQDVTFDMFWKRYDDKLNSSKKKTLIKWNRMRETERVKAYRFIGKYFSSIPDGTRKKYAETYLNAELWNN
ncbi:MAG: hypothetical protein FWC34_09130 [Bacteroidetes bacterium]|nr:hypothetical protein [Bacteroidota bacterium]